MHNIRVNLHLCDYFATRQFLLRCFLSQNVRMSTAKKAAGPTPLPPAVKVKPSTRLCSCPPCTLAYSRVILMSSTYSCPSLVFSVPPASPCPALLSATSLFWSFQAPSLHPRVGSRKRGKGAMRACRFSLSLLRPCVKAVKSTMIASPHLRTKQRRLKSACR